MCCGALCCCCCVDYYHAHPDRLESDLSQLTSPEYENMVPPELLDTFHVDKDKIEAKIKENDAAMMEDTDSSDSEETADDSMETDAVEEYRWYGN